MRTKLLLSAAVLGVAGIIAASAQVYSVNVVGYVNVTLDPGFNLVANPLDNGANQLSTLIPTANFGDQVFRYSGGSFQDSTFLGTWSADFELAPGEGFFYNNTSTEAVTVVFVGEVLQLAASNMQVPAGLSLLGSTVPQAVSVDTVGFPGGFGDTIFFFRSDTPGGPKGYKDFTNLGTGFVPEAVPGVAEGFWVSSTAGGAWDRNFEVQ